MANYVEHAIYFKTKKDCKKSFGIIFKDEEITQAMDLYDDPRIVNDKIIVFAAKYCVADNLGPLLVEKLSKSVQFEIHSARDDGDACFETDDCSDYDESDGGYHFYNKKQKNSIDLSQIESEKVYKIDFRLRREDPEESWDYFAIDYVFDNTDWESTLPDLPDYIKLAKEVFNKCNCYLDVNDGEGIGWCPGEECYLFVEGVAKGQQIVEFLEYYNKVKDRKFSGRDFIKIEETDIQLEADSKPAIATIEADSKSATKEATLKEPVKSTAGVPEGMVFVEGGKDKYCREIKDFYICNHTVTQKEFEEVTGINPSYFQHGNPDLSDDRKQNLEADTSDYPVESVSWYDAIYYCNKRSIEEGLTPVYEIHEYGKDNKISDVTKWHYEPCKGCKGKKLIRNNEELLCNPKADGYRLPTKIEWEYAARGGKEIKEYSYSGSDDIDEVGWYKDNSRLVTHKVMQKKPNELGLYDMSGNIMEWVWDVTTYGHGTDSHDIRGGGWDCCVFSCWVDYSYDYGVEYQYRSLGFRIVRSAL